MKSCIAQGRECWMDEGRGEVFFNKKINIQYLDTQKYSNNECVVPY